MGRKISSKKIKIRSDRQEFEIDFDTPVEIEWTENGKVLLAEREHEMTNGNERKREAGEFNTKMKVPFFRLAYYLTQECYMGNVKMPMTKNNSFTLLMPL